MSRIVRRPAANRDLIEVYRYYARKAGCRTADRFLARAEATFKRLATVPGLGTIYNPDEPAYPDLRYMPVSRFRAYVIFDRSIADGIEVYRVLHGARDLDGTLDAEFEMIGSEVLADGRFEIVETGEMLVRFYSS